MAPQICNNVLEMIGNTPLIRVRHIDTGPCELFLKLENQNPGGSIKDRIGLYLIEAAEREGKIKPGGTLIEATAGNTGVGLALVLLRHPPQAAAEGPEHFDRAVCRAAVHDDVLEVQIILVEHRTNRRLEEPRLIEARSHDGDARPAVVHEAPFPFANT